jgi:hypothetical protein
VVLILFDLDLKIYLNGLENKCKKNKKRKTYLLPAAWRPALAGLSLLSLALMGRRSRAACPLLPVPAWAGLGAAAAARPSLQCR